MLDENKGLNGKQEKNEKYDDQPLLAAAFAG
jgi:hypothetical protein